MDSYSDILHSVEGLHDNIVLNYTQFKNVYHSDIDGNSVPVIGFRKETGILNNIFNNPDFFKLNGDLKSVSCYGGGISDVISKINNIKVDTEITSKILTDNKVHLIEMEMHPVPPSILKHKLEDVLFSKKLILKLLQNKKIILVFYFGWEADYFGTHEESDNYNTFYSILLDLYKKYQIPRESIIFLNSNLKGRELDNINPNSEKLPISFYENWFEFETFRRVKGSITNLDNYTFEEHFEKLKKESTHNFLRLNRTSKPERDTMLYWSYCLGDMNKIIFEHPHLNSNFLDIPHLNHLCKVFKHHTTHHVSILEDGRPIYDFIGGDVDKITQLEKLIPLKCMKEDKLKFNILANEPIPHDIYYKAPLSYVFTSFPERPNYVFLNQSVFNPIYNFQPILFYGNYNTITYFQKSGYNSYDWIFNETYDKIEDKHIRLLYSYREMDRINSLGKNKILDLIYDNQEKLIQNRNNLINTNSLSNFLISLNNHINQYNFIKNNI